MVVHNGQIYSAIGNILTESRLEKQNLNETKKLTLPLENATVLLRSNNYSVIIISSVGSWLFKDDFIKQDSIVNCKTLYDAYIYNDRYDDFSPNCSFLFLSCGIDGVYIYQQDATYQFSSIQTLKKDFNISKTLFNDANATLYMLDQTNQQIYFVQTKQGFIYNEIQIFDLGDSKKVLDFAISNEHLIIISKIQNFKLVVLNTQTNQKMALNFNELKQIQVFELTSFDKVTTLNDLQIQSSNMRYQVSYEESNQIILSPEKIQSFQLLNESLLLAQMEDRVIFYSVITSEAHLSCYYNSSTKDAYLAQFKSPDCNNTCEVLVTVSASQSILTSNYQELAIGLGLGIPLLLISLLVILLVLCLKKRNDLLLINKKLMDKQEQQKIVDYQQWNKFLQKDGIGSYRINDFNDQNVNSEIEIINDGEEEQKVYIPEK